MSDRQFTQLPPLSLYVHIPWCIRKCPYCDFNSHERRGEIPEDAYVDALLNDLANEMPLIWGRQISTVFIGGGTPSLFSAESLDKLLSGIRALTALSPSAEVTLEANPGTFEQARFRDYRALGINRLSIGIQSFNPALLSALGRVHSADEALKACDIARSAGFEQINLDIMFALPGQDDKLLLEDIDLALAQSTTHLSFYELTLEPNTLFARFPPIVPEDEHRAQMQDTIVEKLAEAGFERYEVSAYAKHDKGNQNRSAHNMNYWQFGDYVGIGCGAHGKISSADSGSIVRRWKQKHPTSYLDARSADERLGDQTTLSIEDTALEFMMNALRLREGFAIPMFELHTGVSLDRWQTDIEQAMERGLLEQAGLQLRATEQGFNWLNDTLQLFLPGDQTTEAKSYRVIPLNLEAQKPS
ncbi:MAG: radical SAM family heme chaperone HemW [Granulosicoccus sp.]